MIAKLPALARCFQGILPGALATCAADGTPNVTYLSQIRQVDERHVAISRQFFNKTSRNLEANPRATATVFDPVTFEQWKLGLRYVRSETDTPLFVEMALRVEAIASHTGMKGIFRLLSADVCEVEWVRPVSGFLEPLPEGACVEGPTTGPMTEIRALSLVSCRINRAADLESLLEDVLAALDEVFAFHHSMLLLLDETGRSLTTIASRGYGESGVGAEVAVTQGLIGTVAATGAPMRVSGMEALLRYSRAVRGTIEAAGGGAELRRAVPLPGLPHAESQLALPLLVEDRLLGVLALESRDPLAFEEWHESFLLVLANQIAMGIERLSEDAEEEPAPPARDGTAAPAAAHAFLYYEADDCVFVDGEYLIRNVPGRILRRLLRAARDEGRREFTNRELRLDASLGLPSVKDNLETRLILLRRRLEEKCPGVRLVPVARGRFALEMDGAFTLEERRAG
ncbi:MAG: GAF domain-containing protein [Thermoanaerobaculia bacterium]